MKRQLVLVGRCGKLSVLLVMGRTVLMGTYSVVMSRAGTTVAPSVLPLMFHRSKITVTSVVRNSEFRDMGQYSYVTQL